MEQLNLECITCHLNNKIFTIQLNRADKLNAFDDLLFMDLSKSIKTVKENQETRVVVITGTEKIFSAGGNLRKFIEYQQNTDQSTIERDMRYGQKLFDLIEALPQPTIAAINGHAMGAGLQITFACDFRIMVDDARVGLPDVKNGIIPGIGGTSRLPNLIGVAKAKELVLLGDQIDAQTALKIGMVNQVISRENLAAAVEKLAARLLNRSPLALAAAKELINTAAPLSKAAAMQAVLLKTEDSMEGFKAFLEKRTPQFQGK